MVCSFFGHKDTPLSIYPLLLTKVESLIQDRNVRCFLVGNHGDFDSMVLRALRELKRKYPSICYNVVLAYVPGHKKEYEFHEATETLVPEGIETIPKRFAISWRNKWMVWESDLILCYISHTWGGAAQFVKYAERQGKEVINISI